MRIFKNIFYLVIGLGQAQLHFIALISKTSVATPNDKVREFLRTFRSFQWQSEEVFILSVNKSQWHVRDMSTFQVMTLKSNVITRGLVRPSQNKSHTLWLVWRTPSSTLTIVSSRDSVKVGANCRHLLLSPFPKGKVRWWEHKISTWQRISYKITNLDHPFHFTRTCYL